MKRIFLALPLFFSCTNLDSDENYKLEYIDAESTERVRQLIESGVTQINVDSSGGYTRSALLIAELFLSNDISIVIEGECSSSCAEYVLPSASSISLIGRPAIALHENTQMRRSVSKSIPNLTDHERECLEVMADWAEDVVQRGGGDKNHHLRTLDRLGTPQISSEKSSGDCPIIKFDFDPDIWLLTSSELKRFLPHKNITGSLCADYDHGCDIFFKNYKQTIKSAYLDGAVIFP